MGWFSWMKEGAQSPHLRYTANTYWVIKGGGPFLALVGGMSLMKVSLMKNDQTDATLLLWRWMKGAIGQGMWVVGLQQLERQTGSFLEAPERNPALLTPSAVRITWSLGSITAKCLSWCLAHVGCSINGHSDEAGVLKVLHSSQWFE